MTGKRIGYVRVSTFDQNPERQLENIELDKKFIDRASAVSRNRPQLKMMMEFVREDDIVIIHSMDRLARNLRDLKDIVDELVSQKVQVHFIKENLKFSGSNDSISNLILCMMGAFAEFEYAFIKERQLEGIELAKRKGRYKGRKRALDEAKLILLKEAMRTRKSKSQIARELGVCNFTLYKYLAEMGYDNKKNHFPDAKENKQAMS
jgi:DNA invertase Pin-like site-specific DNA recombinase